ncbi:hypothetical protein E8E13_001117 [Curvularia kusanoi]|uniref:Uncharacterized protein n=1 Tax=Curvularia kusanoi TaxID=90978 RepID=A0A9P4W9G0_CURKU|nr:hypothetical protein E8E13_001117 [Curvularia kusanoi]
MHMQEDGQSAGGTSESTSPKSQKSSTMRVVYIVIDTCYATLVDFDQGKGTTRIDSVHTTSQAANGRAKKIMFARSRPGDRCHIDQDRILEEIKDGMYAGIGIGEEPSACYARKCEVEAKPVDLEDDGSSENDEDHDGEDWNMG